MTTLHIFNPEHDLALAADLPRFTPPHAARQLRYDFGFLPALWASDEDLVLVDDVEQACRGLELFSGYSVRRRGTKPIQPRLVTASQLSGLSIDRVQPWGWDAPLYNHLLNNGVDINCLPSFDDILEVRMLSHRRTAMQLLDKLHASHPDGIIGRATECRSLREVAQAMTGPSVLKAPWSSSGRGVRFVIGEMRKQTVGWMQNVQEKQGSIMVEPLYDRVCDFGMEFASDGRGRVEYLGLSLFHTSNGAYTGNLLATETRKRLLLSRWLPLTLLREIRLLLCQLTGRMFDGKYAGPFGIDMMVVRSEADGSCLLHPCVELNLRRTMGHVALALSPDDDDVQQVMRILPPPDHYRLVIERLNEGKHVRTV